MDMPLSVALPVLDSVIVCGVPLVPTGTFVKVRDDGESVAIGNGVEAAYSYAPTAGVEGRSSPAKS